MWQFFYYAMCYSFGLSLTIIINDVDQYFKKTIKSKKIHSATCQILMDEWKLIMSTSHYGCSCNGIA
jgi:hypothetical protein